MFNATVQLYVPVVALKMLLTGGSIDDFEARRWGLVDAVVDDNAVLSAACELAERIAASSPRAVRASKRIAYAADDGVLADEQCKWLRMAEQSAHVFESDDATEGARAFAGKRRPVWTGR